LLRYVRNKVWGVLTAQATNVAVYTVSYQAGSYTDVCILHVYYVLFSHIRSARSARSTILWWWCTDRLYVYDTRRIPCQQLRTMAFTSNSCARSPPPDTLLFIAHFFLYRNI